MAPSASKKRKLSPSDRIEHYAKLTAAHSSQDSSNEEGKIVLGKRAIRSGRTNPEATRNAMTSWNSILYDLNMFKLKANELLARVRPDYERRMADVDSSLRKLKHIIERIPEREAKPVRNAIFFCQSSIKCLTFQ